MTACTIELKQTDHREVTERARRTWIDAEWLSMPEDIEIRTVSM